MIQFWDDLSDLSFILTLVYFLYITRNADASGAIGNSSLAKKKNVSIF